MTLQSYFEDGAKWQAQAVLACVKGLIGDGIESSWDDEYKSYSSEIKVGRWENGREQGYCISMRNKKFEQLNICFFEHRNSDCINALKWIQNTMNTPNIDTIPQEVYPDKWHSSKSVGFGEFIEMAEWIKDELEKHWDIDN